MNAKSITSTVRRQDTNNDAPRITREWAEKAELRVGNTILREASPPMRIGRPPKNPEDLKRPVSFRLPRELLDAARATGPGWQTRAVRAIEREFLGDQSAKKSTRSRSKPSSMTALAAAATAGAIANRMITGAKTSAGRRTPAGIKLGGKSGRGSKKRTA